MIPLYMQLDSFLDICTKYEFWECTHYEWVFPETPVYDEVAHFVARFKRDFFEMQYQIPYMIFGGNAVMNPEPVSFVLSVHPVTLVYNENDTLHPDDPQVPINDAHLVAKRLWIQLKKNNKKAFDFFFDPIDMSEFRKHFKTV